MATKGELIDRINKELILNEDKYKTMYAKEKDLQNKVISVFKKVFKEDMWFSKISDRYNRGIPDIVGCVCGRFFGLELKRDKGRPSELQLYTINRIEKAGGTVCIVRTVEESLMTIKSILMT